MAQWLYEMDTFLSTYHSKATTLLKMILLPRREDSGLSGRTYLSMCVGERGKPHVNVHVICTLLLFSAGSSSGLQHFSQPAHISWKANRNIVACKMCSDGVQGGGVGGPNVPNN